MTPQEITLQECLSAVGLRELPPKITASYNKTWLRAICLVTKVGGLKEYCLCDNDGNGHPVVKRDFGKCAAIVLIDSIHPYEEADKADIPALDTDEKIIKYLCKSKHDKAEIQALLAIDGKSIEQIHADRATIDKYIKDIAHGYQKRKADETRRVKNIRKKKDGNDND